jgi:hypothetical protein
MGVHSEESHLAFRIPAVGAVCIAVDKLSDSEAICGLSGERW